MNVNLKNNWENNNVHCFGLYPPEIKKFKSPGKIIALLKLLKKKKHTQNGSMILTRLIAHQAMYMMICWKIGQKGKLIKTGKNIPVQTKERVFRWVKCECQFSQKQR